MVFVVTVIVLSGSVASGALATGCFSSVSYGSCRRKDGGIQYGERLICDEIGMSTAGC